MENRLPEWEDGMENRDGEQEPDGLPSRSLLAHWDALVDESFVDRLHRDFLSQVAHFRSVLFAERANWIGHAACGRAGGLVQLMFAAPPCELVQTVIAVLAPRRSPDWCGHTCVQVVDDATRMSLAVMALEWVERLSWREKTASRPDASSDLSGVDCCDLARVDSILGVRHVTALQQARVLDAPVVPEPRYTEVAELLSGCARSRLLSWAVPEDDLSELVINSAWRHLPSLTEILGVQSFDN